MIIIVGGLFAEAFVRQRLVVYRDPAATASNILAHELLYRLGFAARIIVVLCNLPLASIFYDLFKRVNKSLAMLVVFFILVATAIESVSLLGHFAPLILLKGGSHLSTFNPDQLQALAYIPLRLQSVGYDLSLAFFGFYCLLTGYLIFRSTFLPRILGLLMAIAGLCYLTNSFVHFLAPQYSLFPYILVPCLVAEASLCLWLIVRGVNLPKWEKKASVGPKASML